MRGRVALALTAGLAVGPLVACDEPNPDCARLRAPFMQRYEGSLRLAAAYAGDGQGGLVGLAGDRRDPDAAIQRELRLVGGRFVSACAKVGAAAVRACLEAEPGRSGAAGPAACRQLDPEFERELLRDLER